MPKVKISEYSATANSNTDVASINIDEGCAPSGINNAIRAVMGHLKDFQSGTSNDPFTVGSSGSLTLSYGTANGVAYLNGSKVLTTGSALVFDGTNLGIAVTAPTANLQIGAADGSARSIVIHTANQGDARLRFREGGTVASGYNEYSFGMLGLSNALTFESQGLGEIGRFDTNGNFLVGVTSGSARLNVGGSAPYMYVTDTAGANKATFVAESTNTVVNVGSSYLGTSAVPLALIVGGAEKARIDTSGNLLVGKTSTSDTVIGTIQQSTGRIASAMAATVNGIDTLTCYSTGAAAYRFYVGMGGTVYATNTTISSLSDQRHKENIRNLNVGLAEVMALKPRLFDWKEGKGADIKNARGFIAQEFEEVFPDLIDEWKDPAPEGEEPYKSVRQDLIPVLVKAIQEQQAIITQLTARITALEGA